jgi:hypothetical protein
MQFLLEDFDDYEIYFSHQCDDRVFNRGAVKNLGFLAIKEKYPNHYKNMTFIFNDVDTMPFNKIFSYHTTPGTVAHYYGFKYTLGGIVVMKGCDFEKINGFPNLWGWGQEDNCLQYRCNKFNIKIDRSTFYPIGSPQILQLFDGISRIINNTDAKAKTLSDDRDGISTLSNIHWSIDKKSTNSKDNQFTVSEFDKNVHYINTTNFRTFTPYNIDSFLIQDLRTKSNPKHKTNNNANTQLNYKHNQHQQQQQTPQTRQHQQQQTPQTRQHQQQQTPQRRQQHHHQQQQTPQRRQQHHHQQQQHHNQQQQNNQLNMIKNANNWSIIPNKY